MRQVNRVTGLLYIAQSSSRFNSMKFFSKGLTALAVLTGTILASGDAQAFGKRGRGGCGGSAGGCGSSAGFSSGGCGASAGFSSGGCSTASGYSFQSNGFYSGSSGSCNTCAGSSLTFGQPGTIQPGIAYYQDPTTGQLIPLNQPGSIQPGLNYASPMPMPSAGTPIQPGTRPAVPPVQPPRDDANPTPAGRTIELAQPIVLPDGKVLPAGSYRVANPNQK